MPSYSLAARLIGPLLFDCLCSLMAAMTGILNFALGVHAIATRVAARVATRVDTE